MALKSYQLTQNFRSPYVVATGLPHRPQQIKFKTFRKGDVVKGELKHSNNEPAFVLVAGTLVIPVSMIKEVVTKEIDTSSNFDNKKQDSSSEDKKTENKIVVKKSSNVKYVDALLIGAAVGFLGVYVAEKQNWITSIDNKNRIYGAIGGAVLGAYIVYRIKNK
jgi:hypothetical protein